MTKPIHVITRQRHLDHFFKVIPFIFGIFVMQCFLFKSIFPNDPSIGNMCFFLGSAILLLLSLFLQYDLQHKVHIYENYITVNFKLLFINKIIKVTDIKEVIVSEQNAPFANILLNFFDGSKMNFYFVDEAEKVARIIHAQQNSYSQAA